jgi:hypothetical protein
MKVYVNICIFIDFNEIYILYVVLFLLKLIAFEKIV